ncbi:MAG: hypothetical protein J6Q27_02760, partial [Clostridia bacterium]|nr:hypothetical protein [Clostridia bacterium]
FENGFDGFSDHEILEMLLQIIIPRRDTNELAHQILDKYMTLANVFEADAESLMKIKGLGINSATLLSMISHLCRAYDASKYAEKNFLYDTESIGQYAISLLKGNVNEVFALICLNSNRRVHWSGIIATTGLIDRIEAHPRLVVSEVLKHNAKTVVLAHNHPNGSLYPSPADKAATSKLIEVLKGIEVTVLDHIIVSENRFYSMAEMGFTF